MVKILLKKKLLFLRLVFIFSGFTFLSLIYLWGTTPGNSSSQSMMSQSMGQMMQNMHGQNLSLNDLIIQEESSEQTTGVMPKHGSTQEHLQIGHYLTTLIIVFLVPFVLAGGVFLLIIWFR